MGEISTVSTSPLVRAAATAAQCRSSCIVVLITYSCRLMRSFQVKASWGPPAERTIGNAAGRCRRQRRIQTRHAEPDNDCLGDGHGRQTTLGGGGGRCHSSSVGPVNTFITRMPPGAFRRAGIEIADSAAAFEAEKPPRSGSVGKSIDRQDVNPGHGIAGSRRRRGCASQDQRPAPEGGASRDSPTSSSWRASTAPSRVRMPPWAEEARGVFNQDVDLAADFGGEAPVTEMVRSRRAALARRGNRGSAELFAQRISAPSLGTRQQRPLPPGMGSPLREGQCQLAPPIGDQRAAVARIAGQFARQGGVLHVSGRRRRAMRSSAACPDRSRRFDHPNLPLGGWQSTIAGGDSWMARRRVGPCRPARQVAPEIGRWTGADVVWQ